MEAVAAQNISGHQVTILNAAGQLEVASCDQASHARQIVGVTVGAASAGAQASVQRFEIIEHSGWAWDPGNAVYLGASGALVQTIPAAALFCAVIGVALSGNKILLGLQPPVFYQSLT